MSEVKNYAIRSKNSAPVNLLRSWFRAQDIPVHTSTVPGFDLTVEGRLGGEVEIQVVLRRDETMPGEGLQVYGPAITGKNPQAALEAYYAVLDVTGYERKPPVDRGPQPAANSKGNPRKLHYRNEPFLVAIRHTEFRRSPNPTPEQWARYKGVMEKATWHFLRNSVFAELARRNGEDFHSLMTVVRCWVTNFCASSEIPEAQTVWHDNERKCYTYLVQRFNEYAQILRKKERSTHPDMETVNIGLFSKPDADTEVSPEPVVDRPIDFDLDLGISFDNDDVTDYDYVRAHCQLDTSTPEARRASASDILNKLLSQMSHDEMVHVLQQTSVLDRFDPETRAEAARQLKVHGRSCQDCQAAQASEGAEEDEETACLDGAGTAE